MTSVLLLLNRTHWQYSACRTLAFSGRIFYQQVEICAETLLQLLLSDKGEFNTEKTAALAGFFSIVIQQSDALILITDRVRSFPLFYRKSDNQLQVSDDCMSLSNNMSLDEIACREFTSLGYVTGNDTLYQATKQVPAATVIRFDATTTVEQRYFIFKRTAAQSTQSEAQLMQTLHSLMASLVDECVKLAAGRQIVVPLSGGYDSRAILLFLQRTGYKNIHTFTFGAATSPEIAVAGQLARELKVSWTPVFYTVKMWRELRHDAEFDRYLHFITNGVSVPNIQVWPAIRILLQQGVIEPNALLLPGHTGDFVSGGHLSGETTAVTEMMLPEISLAIYKKYYQLDKLPVFQPLLERIQSNCKGLLEEKPDWTVEGLKDAWNWQERQSKFIVNSNRYYDFFQLEWWMPFWQVEFVDFWLQVPTPMLRQQILWRCFVDFECQQSSVSKVTGNAAYIIKVPQFLYRGLNYFFDRSLLLWFVPFGYWLRYRLGVSKHSGTLNSYLTRLILRKLVNRTKNSEN